MSHDPTSMPQEKAPAPNPATLWATLFVDELVRAGLREACIAPGSRSTPLTIAFASHPAITVHSLLDERSAAFFALGIGLATGQPAAVVCTSGTAAANFYPAIVEANYSHVPLLVLTADRPSELRGSGANQTVDQVKMYGDQVRWFVDVALPENDPDPLTLRYLRTLAGRAIGAAKGLPPGPVQLNFPFRKPLEPVPLPGFIPPAETGARVDPQPFVSVSRGKVLPDADDLDVLVTAILRAKRGLIVCGPRCSDEKFPGAVVSLARAVGFPVFADALSGVRFGATVLPELVFAGYETFLPALKPLAPPDLVIHFGAMPISARLGEYLGSLPPETHRFAIRASGDWQDDTYTTSHLMWADPEWVCEELTVRASQHEGVKDQVWITALAALEKQVWKAVDLAAQKTYFEGLILADVVEAMPRDGTLFVASSLPVRHLDQFVRPHEKELRVFANRGASGIDGTISSALGVASVSSAPVALVIGDLAFYHDLNGLLALKRCGVKATIVLINNDGGGIFRRLPVARFDPPFTDLFLTPHGLDFEPAVRMFGAGYSRVESREAFRKIFRASSGSDIPIVIEVPTDSSFHEEMRLKISSQFM